MIREQYLLGAPFRFNPKLYIYPPTVNDSVTMDNFWQYVKILTFSQEEIEDELTKDGKELDTILTPLEFLLNNAFHNELYARLVEEAFQLFCHTDILLLYETKQILVGTITDEIKTYEDLDKLFFLDENNFFNFQNEIRSCIGWKPVEKPNFDEDPRVRRIKAKARYRDKIKAKKGIGLKLSTCLVAICCMNMGLNPLNVGEITYASVSELMTVYQDKERYETDIRSLQAGADSKKIKPIYWIRNLD